MKLLTGCSWPFVGTDNNSNKIGTYVDICVVDNMVYRMGTDKISAGYSVCANICVVDSVIYMDTVKDKMWHVLVCVESRQQQGIKLEILLLTLHNKQK